MPGKIHWLRNVLYFLSDTDPDIICGCSKREQYQHLVTGAAMLIPPTQAMCGVCYGTLSYFQNSLFALTCGFCFSIFVLLADRWLIGTFNPFESGWRRLGKSIIRLVIALLMGETITNPIMVALFDDEIKAAIAQEQHRQVSECEAKFRAEIVERDEQILEHRKAIASSNGEILSLPTVAPTSPFPESSLGSTLETKAQGLQEAISDIKERMGVLEREQQNWVSIHQDEIAGKRGQPGNGPKARSIYEDEISTRQEKISKLSRDLEDYLDQHRKLLSMMNAPARLVEREEAEKERFKIHGELLRSANKSRAELLESLQNQIHSHERTIDKLERERDNLVDRQAEEINEIKGTDPALMYRIRVLDQLKVADPHISKRFWLTFCLLFFFDTIVFWGKLLFSQLGDYERRAYRPHHHRGETYQHRPDLQEPDALSDQTEVSQHTSGLVLASPDHQIDVRDGHKPLNQKLQVHQKCHGKSIGEQTTPHASLQASNPAPNFDHDRNPVSVAEEVIDLCKNNSREEVARQFGITAKQISPYSTISKLGTETKERLRKVAGLSLDDCQRAASHLLRFPTQEEAVLKAVALRAETSLSQKQFRLQLRELKALHKGK